MIGIVDAVPPERIVGGVFQVTIDFYRRRVGNLQWDYQVPFHVSTMPSDIAANDPVNPEPIIAIFIDKIISFINKNI